MFFAALFVKTDRYSVSWSIMIQNSSKHFSKLEK